MPPKYYLQLMREPDFIFLNPQAFLYISICTCFFCIGILFWKVVCKEFKLKYDIHNRLTVPYNYICVYILIPVMVLLSLNIYSIYLIINNNSSVFLYLALDISSFGTIKNQIELTDSLGAAGPMAASIALWALYNFFNYKDQISKKQKIIISLFIFLIIFSCIFRAVIKVARYEMMPLLFGLLVIYIHYKYKTKSNFKILLYLSFFLVSVISIFGVFSFTRGFATLSDVFQSIVGYTLTSYNHMAALLSGKLIYLNPGNLYYLLSFFQDAPLLKDSLSSGYFNWPATDLIRYREFSDTFRAGLNGSYIWLTSYGYLWISLGYLTPLVFLINGILMEFYWAKFINGKQSGLIFYPWLFFCIIFWFGTSMLTSKFTVSIIITYLFIKFYDWIFIRIFH